MGVVCGCPGPAGCPAELPGTQKMVSPPKTELNTTVGTVRSSKLSRHNRCLVGRCRTLVRGRVAQLRRRRKLVHGLRMNMMSLLSGAGLRYNENAIAAGAQ